MKTYKVGETYNFPEHDGIHTKVISKILWSHKGSGGEYSEKIDVLETALEWCLVLFEDGSWIYGVEFPIKSN